MDDAVPQPQPARGDEGHRHPRSRGGGGRSYRGGAGSSFRGRGRGAHYVHLPAPPFSFPHFPALPNALPIPAFPFPMAMSFPPLGVVLPRVPSRLPPPPPPKASAVHALGGVPQYSSESRNIPRAQCPTALRVFVVRSLVPTLDCITDAVVSAERERHLGASSAEAEVVHVPPVHVMPVWPSRTTMGVLASRIIRCLQQELVITYQQRPAARTGAAEATEGNSAETQMIARAGEEVVVEKGDDGHDATAEPRQEEDLSLPQQCSDAAPSYRKSSSSTIPAKMVVDLATCDSASLCEQGGSGVRALGNIAFVRATAAAAGAQAATTPGSDNPDVEADGEETAEGRGSGGSNLRELVVAHRELPFPSSTLAAHGWTPGQPLLISVRSLHW